MFSFKSFLESSEEDQPPFANRITSFDAKDRQIKLFPTDPSRVLEPRSAGFIPGGRIEWMTGEHLPQVIELAKDSDTKIKTEKHFRSALFGRNKAGLVLLQGDKVIGYMIYLMPGDNYHIVSMNGYFEPFLEKLINRLGHKRKTITIDLSELHSQYSRIRKVFLDYGFTERTKGNIVKFTYDYDSIHPSRFEYRPGSEFAESSGEEKPLFTNRFSSYSATDRDVQPFPTDPSAIREPRSGDALGMHVHMRWMIGRDMPEVLAIAGRNLPEVLRIAKINKVKTEAQFRHLLGQRNIIGMVIEQGESVIGYILYQLLPGRLRIMALDSLQPKEKYAEIMLEKLISKLSNHRRTEIVFDMNELIIKYPKIMQFFRNLGFIAKPLGSSIRFTYNYKATHSSQFDFAREIEGDEEDTEDE